MSLQILLNEVLNKFDVSLNPDVVSPIIYKFDENFIYLKDDSITHLQSLLEKIYIDNKEIKSRFSREEIYKYVKSQAALKRSENKFFEASDVTLFFREYLNIEPRRCEVVAPISGIRLDHGKEIEISVFKIKKRSPSEVDNSEYHISVTIDEIYDNKIAIELARNKFLDFIRIVSFISGRNDDSVYIRTGFPLLVSMTHQQMYIESSSYTVNTLEENIEKVNSSYLGNIFLENKIANKIPLDNPFFCENEDFKGIWDIYSEKNSKKRSIKKRILNAAISIGESALSRNEKNSILYTSMAFEILFSLDENALFQKSIGDKLADTLAFIIANNKESRLNVIRDVKKFYGLRSALVHGGDANINKDYIYFNTLLSMAISELLNNTKYTGVRNIEDLYEMVREAQNSY